jgi:hypothetical protein
MRTKFLVIIFGFIFFSLWIPSSAEAVYTCTATCRDTVCNPDCSTQTVVEPPFTSCQDASSVTADCSIICKGDGPCDLPNCNMYDSSRADYCVCNAPTNTCGLAGIEENGRCDKILSRHSSGSQCNPITKYNEPCIINNCWAGYTCPNGNCVAPILCPSDGNPNTNCFPNGCTTYSPTCTGASSCTCSSVSEYACSGTCPNVYSPDNPAPPACAVALDPKSKTCPILNTAIGPISTKPADFVKSMFSFVLGIGGGIALILIIVAGYRYITSQANPEKVKAATEQLTAAIVGLLFIILSFVLLQIIGVDILKIPGFTK